MMTGARLLAAALGVAWLSGIGGCAREVVRDPVALSATKSVQTLQLRSPAAIVLDSGYERRLAAGAVLVELGRVPQGRVFKPVNTVLTVKGAHSHEAYPVLRDNSIVGFYLPVEKAFSPLSLPVPLQLERTGNSR